MNTPKIKFINTTLSKEVDLMYGFLFEHNWGWGKYIIKKHPKIKQVFSCKTKKERINFFRKYIIEFRKKIKNFGIMRIYKK